MNEKQYLYKFHQKNAEKVTIKVEQQQMILLQFLGNGSCEFDAQKIFCTPNNLLILSNVDEIVVTSVEKQKEVVVNLLTLSSDFFDMFITVQMSDCPIFYDFIRLQSEAIEYFVFDCYGQRMVKTYFALLCKEATSYDPSSLKMVKCAFLLFMTALHRVHQECLVISESSMMVNYEIGKYLRYMVDHYQEVTLTSMAEHFNFHPVYFSNLFKQLANATFSEKLLLIKLEQAKRLLVTTNLPVHQIVELIGFKEKSYFFKVFKRQYHMTPKEYRKTRDTSDIAEYHP